MQKHRRVLPLLAAFFVWLSMVYAPAAVAEGWPASLGDTSNNVTLTQPSGNVTVAGCGKGVYEQRTFNSAGTQTAVLKQTAAGEYYTCSDASAMAPDGTVYTIKATLPKYEIVAVRGGQAVGKPVRVSNLCSSNDTGYVIGLRYTAHGMFVLIEHDRWQNCASKYLLVRIDTQTGSVAGRVSVQNGYVDRYESLNVTRHHLVIKGNQTINYVPFSLSASGIVSVKFEARSWTAAQTAVTFGGISYAAHEAVTPSASCGSSSDQYEKVAAYNQHNLASIWTYKLPACTFNVRVHAAPFDIAVLNYYVMLPGGSRRHEVVALSTDGIRMWQPHVLSSKTLKGNDYANDAYVPNLRVDNNGNLVVRRIYWYTPGNYRVVAFQFISLFSGKLTDEYLTERATPGGRPPSADYAVGMTNGRLYFSMGQKLYMLPVARIGLDYPRAAVYGVEPQPIRDALYAALGDSFSSGEGVPPFMDRLPVCHQSTRAYPKLLDSDLGAKLALTGFGACSGAVTDDITNTVNGRPPAHGLPLQESFLGSGIKVITITIGGNDVEFERYAKDCIATLSPLGSCSSESAQYQKTIGLIKNSLPARLDKVYAAIKQRSPQAKVYVVGYAQIVPAEKIPAYPGTCRYLDDTERFAARTVVTNLNYQLSQAVNRIKQKGGNFEFVSVNDTGSPFIGHELCTKDAYFNGLSFPPAYTFHPNVLGQAAYAKMIKEVMTS